MTDTSDNCKQLANSLSNALVYAPSNTIHMASDVARQFIDVLTKAAEELERQEIIIREQTDD